MRKSCHLLFLVAIGVSSGCANVMYYQRFRPVDMEIHLSVDRPTSVLVWVPKATAAAAVISKLEMGSFSAADLGEPTKYTATRDKGIVVAADGYGVRTCGLRVLGLPRPRNPNSRPVLVVAVEIESATTYHIFAVSHGRSVSHYEVDVESDPPEVLEVVSGHPASQSKRGKDRDHVTLFISGLRGSTPNRPLNPTVGPVTGLANCARPTPAPAAGYACVMQSWISARLVGQVRTPTRGTRCVKKPKQRCRPDLHGAQS